MKIQNINAVRERIRQVKIELARLKMLEKLALMAQEGDAAIKKRKSANYDRKS